MRKNISHACEYDFDNQILNQALKKGGDAISALYLLDELKSFGEMYIGNDYVTYRGLLRDLTDKDKELISEIERHYEWDLNLFESANEIMEASFAPLDVKIVDDEALIFTIDNQEEFQDLYDKYIDDEGMGDNQSAFIEMLDGSNILGNGIAIVGEPGLTDTLVLEYDGYMYQYGDEAITGLVEPLLNSGEIRFDNTGIVVDDLEESQSLMEGLGAGYSIEIKDTYDGENTATGWNDIPKNIVIELTDSEISVDGYDWGFNYNGYLGKLLISRNDIIDALIHQNSYKNSEESILHAFNINISEINIEDWVSGGGYIFSLIDSDEVECNLRVDYSIHDLVNDEEVDYYEHIYPVRGIYTASKEVKNEIIVARDKYDYDEDGEDYYEESINESKDNMKKTSLRAIKESLITDGRKPVSKRSIYLFNESKKKALTESFANNITESVDDVVDALFNTLETKGKIRTSFGDKTKVGLKDMIENLDNDLEDVVDAIFVNAKKGKISTGMGDKTRQGLRAMIKNARNLEESMAIEEDDERLDILDRIDNARQIIGDAELLDSFVLAMDTERVLDILDYIERMHDIGYEDEMLESLMAKRMQKVIKESQLKNNRKATSRKQIKESQEAKKTNSPRKMLKESLSRPISGMEYRVFKQGNEGMGDGGVITQGIATVRADGVIINGKKYDFDKYAFDGTKGY